MIVPIPVATLWERWQTWNPPVAGQVKPQIGNVSMFGRAMAKAVHANALCGIRHTTLHGKRAAYVAEQSV